MARFISTGDRLVKENIMGIMGKSGKHSKTSNSAPIPSMTEAERVAADVALVDNAYGDTATTSYPAIKAYEDSNKPSTGKHSAK